MEPFANSLKKRALELGVSNAEIARRLGITERRYAHYARGDREPDLATLTRIAAVFRTSTDELLGLSEPAERSDREMLIARLLAAADGLADRDLALVIALAEATQRFAREDEARG